MRGQELWAVLTDIDMELVKEAALPRHHRLMPRLLALAACLALVMGGALWAVTHRPLPELPLLTIQEMDPATDIGSGSMGVVWVNTLDDIPKDDLSPAWDDTVPVYTREAVSTDPMVTRQRVLRAGELLGMAEATLTATTSQYMEIEERFAYYFILENDKLRVEAGREATTVRVFFKEPFHFPEGFAFADDGFPTEEEWKLLEPALATLCQEQLNMSSPVATYAYGAVHTNGKQPVHLTFQQEDGLSVFFFYPNLDNPNEISACDVTLPVEHLGDYPIISREEAYERLLDGHYLGLPGYGKDSPQPEERVDLVYYADWWQTASMPYYRFYVYSHSFPQQDGEGEIKVYEEYYVPAVHSHYLAALPQDGVAVPVNAVLDGGAD